MSTFFFVFSFFCPLWGLLDLFVIDNSPEIRAVADYL